MQAVVHFKYGSPEVLELNDIERPSVKNNEVLIRIRAAGINPADWHFMRGDPYLVRLLTGRRKPRKVAIVGSDMASQVEEVGGNVTQFRPGDEVYAEAGTAAGAQGSYAEYTCLPEGRSGFKPPNITFEQAAAVPLAAMAALIGYREVGDVQPGHKVLINGASGGVGTFAVQIAKAFGAEVTGVCSTRNVDMVRSLGADHAIDYTREDFTQSEQRYSMILDTVENRPMSQCRRVLTAKGTLGVTGGGGGPWLGPGAQQLRVAMLSPFVSQKMAAVNDKPNKDLRFLKKLIENGKVAPVIDKVYPLDKAPEAMRHLETGHAQGKAVITVPHNNECHTMAQKRRRLFTQESWGYAHHERQDRAAETSHCSSSRRGQVDHGRREDHPFRNVGCPDADQSPGGVLRIFAGDFVAGEIEGRPIGQAVWLGIAVLMLAPIVMVVLSLTLTYPAIRWATIVVAILLFAFNPVPCTNTQATTTSP